MAKGLLKAQEQKIKQFYLQNTDKELAQICGSDVKTVKAFRVKNNLKRDEITEARLAARQEVVAETVEPGNNAGK